MKRIVLKTDEMSVKICRNAFYYSYHQPKNPKSLQILKE